MQIQSTKPLLLVVEDEADMRDNYRDLLGSDYTLIFCETGYEAIAEFQLSHSRFKAIILDINLPDMSGHEVVKQFEAISFLDIPPIIVVTAYGESQEVIRTMTDSQAFFHLSKPFSIKTLQEVLSNAIKDPYFVRRNFELARDLQLDQWLSQRNSKLLEELRVIKAQSGSFVTLKDVDPYVFHNKGIAKKNLPLDRIIYDFEYDSGIAAPPMHPPSILILENEPDLLDSLSLILTEAGFKTFATRDSFTGVNIIRENPDLDLILLDLGLPGLHGEEIIKELKAQLGWSDISVEDTLSHPDIVVYTGHADHQTITSAIKEGSSKYLVKPILSADLLQALHEVLFRRHALRILPEMLNTTLKQPTSYRHRLMQFETETAAYPGPTIPGSLVLAHFPDIPSDKIGAGIPKAALANGAKPVIDGLRGFSHTDWAISTGQFR